MKSPWRFFPLAVVAAIGLVVVVNGGMIYAAVHSFPGKANEEGFALSNHYDAVLAVSEREAALGWTVAVRLDDAGHPVVTLGGRDGGPLRGASVAAEAERPLGAIDQRRLLFSEIEAGRYVADGLLSVPGQWELTLAVSAGSDTMAVTRRVIVH